MLVRLWLILYVRFSGHRLHFCFKIFWFIINFVLFILIFWWFSHYCPHCELQWEDCSGSGWHTYVVLPSHSFIWNCNYAMPHFRKFRWGSDTFYSNKSSHSLVNWMVNSIFLQPEEVEIKAVDGKSHPVCVLSKTPSIFWILFSSLLILVHWSYPIIALILISVGTLFGFWMTHLYGTPFEIRFL